MRPKATGIETAWKKMIATFMKVGTGLGPTGTVSKNGPLTQSVSTYFEVLDLATAGGLLDPAVHDLSVDAVVNHWTEDDPRWDLLLAAA